MKLIKEFKQFLFEAKRGRQGIDWDTYLVLFSYTKDDHKRYLAAASKRKKEGKESLTDPERFAVNKYMAAAKRNLVPEEFKIQIDWDTYFKENPFTKDDYDLYISAQQKKYQEGKESLTDEDYFARNKYIAASRRNLIPQEFSLDRVDWDAYFKKNPFTIDDYKRYLAASSKRNKKGNEALTDEDRFAENKYRAAAKRNLVHMELTPYTDWDTYFKENPYTIDDYKRYLAASSKRNKKGNESFTDEDRFAENKYKAASRRNLVPEEFKIQIDWDTYFKKNPFTIDDYKRYLAAASKRNKEGKESLTDEDLFAENKYKAALKRNLVPEEFKIQIDWDTYFKENPFTPEDRKRYNFAINKKSRKGSEALTDEDRFAVNKYRAELDRIRKLKNKENEAN